MAELNKEVAVFWDYASCPGPSNCPGYELVNYIRSVARGFGSVKTFKAYLALSDYNSNSRASPSLRSELQSSGVSLTDTPQCGRKDVGDKMLIVDMLAYAMDRAPSSVTLLLISGDRDFAYVVSVLRLRHYPVVLITLPGTHPSLTSQVSYICTWRPVSPSNSDTAASPSNQRTEFRTMNSPDMGRRQRAFPFSRVDNAQSHTFQPEYPELHREIDLDVYLTRRSQSSPILVKLTNSPPRQQEGLQTDDFTSSSVSSSPATLQQTPNIEVVNPKPQPIEQIPALDLKREANTVEASHDKASEAPTNVGTQRPQSPASQRPPSSTASSLATAGQPQPSFLSPAPTSSAPQINPSSTSPATATATAKDKQPRAVPEPFALLVSILRVYRLNGVRQPLRSSIGCDLVNRDKDVYKNAGVVRFAQYVALAEKEGIVELGGSDGRAWVALHPSVG